MNVHFGGFKPDGLAFIDEAQARALDNVEVRVDDVLLNITGASIARVTRAPESMAGGRVNQHVCIIRPTGALRPGFLDYYLASPEAQTTMLSQQSGVTRQALTKSQILNFEVPVAPLEEQNRIVEAIESYFTRLDAAEAALERIQRNLERHRASVLKAAVEGRLVPTEAGLARVQNRDYEPASVLLERILKERRRRWEEGELAKMQAKGKPPKNDKWKSKYKAPSEPDVKDLPELSEGWCWTTVEALSSKVVDGVHKKPNYIDSGVPFITVKNLTAGPGISFEDTRFVSADDHAEFCKRTDPGHGDLLISKDGTLGVVRAVRTNTAFSIFVSVALVKPIDLRMTDYLELAMSSPVVQSQMTPKGSGLQHIHLEDLRRDCIPVPPLDEQRRITAAAAAQLSVVDQMTSDIHGSQQRCARLRQAILKWAFEGKLVDQDPTDEPASVLLERVRAEREAAKAEKATKKKTTTRRRAKTKGAS